MKQEPMDSPVDAADRLPERGGDDLPKEKRTPIVTLDAAIFGDVDVRLKAVLGHGSIAVRTLLDFAEGSVLDLDTPLNGVIDLMLNERVIAQGEIVAVEDHFGIRITKIVAQNA